MQKGISTLAVIIIIVAVAVIAVGGVFVYQYFTAKAQPIDKNGITAKDCPNGVVVNSLNGPQCDVSQNEITAGWKTYTNAQYGFEIKYPTTWQNPTEVGPVKGGAFEISFYKNYVGGKAVNGDGFFISINKRSDQDYRDLSSGVGLAVNPGINSLKNCSIPVSEAVVGIGNYPAKKISIFSSDRCFQPGYSYVVLNGEYSYDIKSRSDGYGCVGCDGEKTTREKFSEFYQILSTFKFTK